MTYSLTEKEEILFEQSLEELFALTEANPIKYASTIWKPDPNKPKFTKYGDRNVTQQELATLKKADATGHWTDQYDYDEPIQEPAIPTRPIIPPGDGSQDGDGDDSGSGSEFDDIPALIPPILKKEKLPKPKLKKPIVLKKLSGPNRKVVPKPRLSHHPEKFVKPQSQKVIKEPVKKITKVKPVKKIISKDVKKDVKKVLPKKVEVKKIQHQADDIIKKLTQKGQNAQAKINLRNRLKAIVTKNPHLLASSKFQKLPPRELKLLQYDPLKGKPAGGVKGVGRGNAPGSKATQWKKGWADPLRITSPKIAKDADPKIAKDAEQKVLKKSKVPPVNTNTAHLVGDDGKPIDKTQTQIDAEAKKEADKIKLKAKAVKEPLPKSKLGQGMVQPKKGQGIKSFAKQLGFNSVADFEKANPDGIGVAKNGNKFVKTGVSYINKAEIDRLNSIAVGKAGKANELKNAKKIYSQLKDKTGERGKILKKQIANLEAEVEGKPKIKPGEVIKGGDKPIQIKDLRSKWNLGRNVDMTKMRGKLMVGAGKKLAGKAGAYAIPGLNVVIMAYDVHALMLGTAGGAGMDVTTQSRYRQNDLKRMDAIINSEASIEEKREALKGLGTNNGIYWDVEGSDKWEDETHNWDADQMDPIMPFVDDNNKELDGYHMTLKDMKKIIPQQVASGPYTQRDIDKVIQRVYQKKEYDFTKARQGPRNKKAYLENYQAKLTLLKSIKKTLPEKRVDAFKKVFSMAIDVQEDHLQAGKTLAFKHINTNVADIKHDAGITPDSDADTHPEVQPDDPDFLKNNALDNALKHANTENEIEKDEYYAELKRKQEEPGLWQRGYDAIADLFTGGDDDQAIAGMATRPSKNNDPEVVTTVGNPYGSPGAPKNFEEYETLMQEIAGEFDLPLPVVRALAMQESGMHAAGGTLGPWSYTGDHDLGKKGAFGIFHVRSDPDRGAALEHYNEVKGTKHTWKDIATDGMLAMKVGATYFKHWYDINDGNAQMAYANYNGGPDGLFKNASVKNSRAFAKTLKRFTESKMYIQKSAILEGIAKAA